MKKNVTLCLTIILCMVFGVNTYASSGMTYEGEQNYLSQKNYEKLGIVTDSPEVFGAADKSEPLGEYEAVVPTELCVGSMNRNSAWSGSFYVMDNVADAASDTFNVDNMYKDLVGTEYNFTEIYEASKNSIEVGSVNACAFDRDGDGTDEIMTASICYEVSTARSKIEFRSHDLVDGKWTTSQALSYYISDPYTQDPKFGCNIDADTIKGYLSMTAGDFDRDGKEEVAAYLPIMRPQSGSAQIWLLDVSSSSGAPSMANRISIDDTFTTTFCQQNGFPVVHLATTGISGEDHLVINIHQQFVDRNVEQGGKVAICKFPTYAGGTISWLYKSEFLNSENGYRMRFSSAVHADINGNRVEELIIGGYKNTGYSDKTAPGKLSADENLIQVLYWTGSNYKSVWDDFVTVPGYGESSLCLTKANTEPVALAAGKLHSMEDSDQIFLEGVVLKFTGAGKTGANEGELLKSGKFETEHKIPLGGVNNAFISTASAGVFSTGGAGAEQLMILSGDHKAGDDNVIYFDVISVWEENGKLTSAVTKNDYINGKDTNDDGTFAFLIPLNADEDTIKVEYTGKTYGWSAPELYCILESAPYWKELQYNDIVNVGVGSSSIAITNGSGDGGSKGWGLGGGLFFDISAMGGVGFLGNGGMTGAGLEFSAVAQYVHDYSKVKNKVETYKFVTSAGDDYAVIYAVPVVNYQYNIWLPETKVTQEYIDEYNYILEESGKDETCPYKVGDVIPAHTEPCTIVVTFNPAFSTLSVDQYNDVIKELGSETNLPAITKNMLSKKVIGDPSTYPATKTELEQIEHISGLHVSEKSVHVSTGSYETEMTYEVTTEETTTEGVDLDVHIGVYSKSEGTVSFFGSAKAEGRGGLSIDGGYNQQWITTDMEGVSYSTILKSLPAGAEDYAFSTNMASYQLKLDGAKPYAISYITQVISEQDLPPAIPDNFSVYATTQNQVVLKWDHKTHRAADSYEIYTLDNVGEARKIGSTKNNYFVVTHLDPATSYQYAIKAKSENGAATTESILSYWVTARTKEQQVTMPTITKQPVSTIVIADDSQQKSMAVEVKPGEGMEEAILTYQWQKYSEGNFAISGTWKDIPNATEISYTLPVLSKDGDELVDSNGNAYDERNYYRVVVTQTLGGNVKSVISKIAAMMVQSEESEYTYHQLDAKLKVLNKESLLTSIEEKLLYGTINDVEAKLDIELMNKDASKADTVPTIGDIYLMYENENVGTYGVLAKAELSARTTTSSGAKFSFMTSELKEKGVTKVYAVYPGNDNQADVYYLPSQSNAIDASMVKEYKVTYQLNGGVNHPQNASKYTEESIMHLQNPMREGYEFTGWYVDQTLKTPLSLESIEQTEDLTLYAAWKEEVPEESNEVVILYENDVHCAIEGYAKLSALKQELLKSGAYAGVVSVGDFLQGSSLGVISKGEYIVNIMNMVGYDAITLGNHEFDFKIPRLLELTELMGTKPICSNFQKIGEAKSMFDPYKIVSYGDVDIAYIGIITPDTLTSSAPAQFKDENGDYLYTFHGTDLCETVQDYIDAAKADGAEYVIALSHLGTENVDERWSAQTLVKNTEGLDVVLDGHSHSVLEELIVKDKNGEEVLISSTGIKFENIGKLTISEDGEFSSELIPTDSYEKTDAKILEYIQQINEEYAALGNRVIGRSLVNLVSIDENGNRLVRKQEANIGDFCADAFRVVTGADIGVVNGGGIRANIAKGEVTFNDILSVFPWNNTVCVAEVTGRQIMDLLEHGVRFYPEENGGYQQVSGLRFVIDDTIPSTVKLDENGIFVSVEGPRRVGRVEVLDSETGTYQPIDLEKTYTLASHNHLLLEFGDGAAMLENAKIIQNDGMLDVELLEIYLTEFLNGEIGLEYESAQNRITIGKFNADVEEDPKDETEEGTEDKSDKNDESVPQSGDTAQVELWMLLLIGSMAMGIWARKKSMK